MKDEHREGSTYDGLGLRVSTLLRSRKRGGVSTRTLRRVRGRRLVETLPAEDGLGASESVDGEFAVSRTVGGPG